MKRLNPQTNKPFKLKDVREDGYIFDGYIKARIKKDGYYKENWRRPDRFQKNLDYKRKRKKELYRKISNYMNEYKMKKGCQECGYNDSPYALEFHHREQKTKKNSVSMFFRNSWNQLDKIIEEAKKCDILCSNCHKILTQKQINNAT